MTTAESAEEHPATGPARDVGAETILAEMVSVRLETITDDLVGKLHDTFPAVAELGAEFLDGVRERTRMLLRAIIGLMNSGVSLEALGPVIERGLRERREQRIPQDVLFDAYGFLQQQFFVRVAREVQDHPEVHRLLAALARRQLEFQWVVSRRGAAAYESGDQAPVASRDESRQAVLEELVGLRQGGAMLAEHATRFGLLLPLDTVAATVRLGASGRVGELLDPRILEIARTHPWSVVGELDGRAVFVGRGLLGPLPVEWGSVPIPPGAVEHPAEMTALVTRASETADVAQKLGRRHGDADALAPFVAVAALPPERREAFLRATFGPLHDSERGVVILDAVAAAGRFGNRREAADHLHVHANTLDARLARFRELTGLDLADPVQRTRCDLGLFLLGRLR